MNEKYEDRAALEVRAVRAMVDDARRRIAVLAELLERAWANEPSKASMLRLELAEVQLDLRSAQSRLVIVERGLTNQQCGRLIRERVKP